MLLMLTKITIIPTATISVLAESLFDIFAAIGEASALPITKPATGSQCVPGRAMITKVVELTMATKNLDSFTVPNENLG